MKAIPWDTIIQNSTFGYTYCKIIRDETGKPVDYIFLDANPAFAKMIGISRENIVNQRVTNLITDIENDSFDWINFFGRIASSGERIEFEEYSRPMDRWFHLSVMSPEPEHFVVLSFDITEKRKAELSLIVSEERNRQYIDNALDGIFISDETGKYTQVNPAAVRMLGFTEGEILGRSLRDFVLPESAESAERTLRTLKKSGHITKKFSLLTKTGETIIAIFDIVALPEGQYMAFGKDITAQEALAQEKEQYYTAFQAMTQPVIITDPTGIMLSVNQAYTKMYGYSREESVGRTPHLLNPGKEVYYNLGYSEEEYNAIFSGLWSHIKDPGCGSWEGVVINRKKDGRLIWTNLVVSAVCDMAGTVTSLIGLPIDITNSREQETKTRIQLYQTVAELAELRDDDTGNHMKRVGIFSRFLAKAYGMNERFCSDIEIFAPMHDIGKVGILDSILRAPRRLTPEESDIMKTHTVLGHNIVKGKKGFELAAEITLHHHEKFDGSGYPYGLAGDAIPLSAQITAIADIYDALRSKRPYKQPWSHEKTVEYIVANAGTHFNPNLVTLFSDLHPRFEKVYMELTD